MLYIDVLVLGFVLVMNSPASESKRVGIPWFAVTNLQFAFLSNDSSGYLKPPAGRYKFQLTVLNSNDANDQCMSVKLPFQFSRPGTKDVTACIFDVCGSSVRDLDLTDHHF